MQKNNNAQELLEIIKNSKHVAVLTGAGISTLSGIPDFRGVGGLYSRKDID
ncbi:MAG: RNA polymerase subunit sigma, partial [Mailhella sp.]